MEKKFKILGFRPVFVRVFMARIPIDVSAIEIERHGNMHDRRKMMAEEDLPLCRFGPGGDFTTDYTAELGEMPMPQINGVSKVLSTIANMIGAAIYPQSGEKTLAVSLAMVSETEFHRSEGTFNADRETTYEAAFTATNANVTGLGKISKEPMLFGNDKGISIGNGHKPKHRLRTSRRPSKTRTGLRIAGQGTLFEINRERARTA